MSRPQARPTFWLTARFSLTALLAGAGLVFVAACGPLPEGDGASDTDGTADRAPAATGKADNAPTYNELNLAAGSAILYELQVRSANACRVDVGSAEQRAACAKKVAPTIPYRAEGMSCGSLADLKSIKLGTLDDLLENTADHRQGITVRYVNERVGANTLWLMPLFPNNDRWAIPDACDDLGSPYAVRDYWHARGTLSRTCIAKKADEYSTTPCFANDTLDKVIAEAHRRGMKVLLDVAFNHFGHNYLMYDQTEYVSVRDRVTRGENLSKLWDFAGTYEANLLRPDVLDTEAKLNALAARTPYHRDLLASLKAKCRTLKGAALVRAYNAWREAFDWERGSFSCDIDALEYRAPGFYLGRNSWDPSKGVGDNFTNNWRDVKFLFHHEGNRAHSWELAREREYLFRILNYWVSRGVDGFRFDHTTDPNGGMGSNEWKYLTSKVNYYAWRRGQKTPIYLAEEFGDQLEMNKVVDIMTEGYVGDMCGRNGATKDTSFVERVLENMNRFGGRVFNMTALETHDEHRLTESTGFDMWTGAGFWGIGATTRSTPMILMGQEFGESYGLGFRRSDFLRSRFVGTAQYQAAGDALIGYYKAMNTQRLLPQNAALLSPNHYYLRPRGALGPDSRIFAQAKWQGANVVFVVHNLWNRDVAQSFYLPPDLAAKLSIQDSMRYRLFDVLSQQQKGACRTGAELKWDFYVHLDAATRAQWLRLERCP